MSKKKIILIHPMNAPKGRPFGFKHAKRLMLSEKTNPSGWVFSDSEDAKLFEPKTDNLQNLSNADSDHRNSGTAKTAKKEGNHKQSDKSRSEDKTS